MSPFKVIRCRYYADDGKAIPPYCSAGRRCTFLHPGDKGWPGGDPAPEVSKRQDEHDQSSEWPRLRAWKSDRSDSHSKAHVSRSGGAAGATSMIDLVSEVSNPSTRRHSTHTSKGLPGVVSIVQTFHDIAKLQTKIIQGRENLDQAINKVTAFRELSESLSKVSLTSAAAVNFTLEAIIKTRHDLELMLEDDTRQLSDLWDDMFNVFLRATCRQIDNELEAGTDFLRQEARKLVKSFSKYSDSSQHSTSSAVDNPGPSQSSAMGGPHEGINTEGNTCDTKRTFVEVMKEEKGFINPPIGLSDNGWGRKRRRVSSDGAGDDAEYADVASHHSLGDTITRMQQQLDEQGDKIKSLIEQNQAMKQASDLQSTIDQSTVKNGVQSLLSGPLHTIAPRVFEDLVSHIRRTLQSDILTFISPALENQKQVNDYWGMQLNALAEELRKVAMINSRHSLEEDAMPTEAT